ncbi:FGGY-family carbohydrate kinase [Listeria booriae]|uniref:FGGY-family carbohydrate kinase n=1 Tax=Listeria booriae TaxID=1552123 RepID=A0A842B3Y3_9LIST|nr:FGGY-family carbohydrate kinase [Listeria booriae]MBC1797049.1 FGGY-family carbohydrate kinase [Listeria booriae]MBC1803056.1 FGGY-family carbohydrate kinase [Listeria booriae]
MLDVIDGRTSLGIEFGSTRIKAVLMDSKFSAVATGSYEWENKLEDGVWTYALDDIWKGLRMSYRKLASEVFEKYGETLSVVGAIGFSAMMHGYMAFDKKKQLLVPFRTWRNSMTEEAEQKLTEQFSYNIPQRWSIAHLYQAILNKEDHIEQIDYLTTLAGYIHWQLTGEKVIGIGDASGMFPIDIATKTYNQKMIQTFSQLVEKEGVAVDLQAILPKVLLAGDEAGRLTQEGAYLLDPTGNLQPGIPICPPEGDAGTGMVATNSVAKRTGNVSVGTSAFAMIVLEKELRAVYPEIDLVTTPSGDLVGMVHTNNCSSDINAWMKLFQEVTEVFGFEVSTEKLFSVLLKEALNGDSDCGGLLSYGYYSGENITGVNEGRPLFVRSPESRFNLANFMRVHLASAFGAMRMGLDILKQEQIHIDTLVGHGGIFKTPEVGQRVLAAAMRAPITVMDTASEGGAWGIALLAAYMKSDAEQSLATFLAQEVFKDDRGVTLEPTEDEMVGYEVFLNRYREGIAIEKQAIEKLK